MDTRIHRVHDPQQVGHVWVSHLQALLAGVYHRPQPLMEQAMACQRGMIQKRELCSVRQLMYGANLVLSCCSMIPVTCHLGC